MPLRNIHVLYLEDDAAVNRSMTKALRSLNCQVTSFMHLADAVLPESEAPDLAILDVEVDGDQSFDLAERLESRNIPVMFLTASDLKSQGGKWAARPICSKPCRLEEITATIKRIVTCGHRQR